MKKQRKVTPKIVSAVWYQWKPSFGKSKVTLIGAILCYSAAMYLSFMYRPTKWKEVFDHLVQKESPWHIFNVIIAISILGWLIDRLGEWCIVTCESTIIKDLKDHCLRGLLGKSTEFFNNHPSGSLVAKTKRFAQVTESVIDEFTFSIIKSVILVVYLIIYSWILVPDLTVAFTLWVAVFMVTTVYISKKRMPHDLASSNADSVTTGHISDILMSVFTLRMFSTIPRVCDTFNNITGDEKRKRVTAWKIGNIQWAVQGALVLILELYCMKVMIKNVTLGQYSIGTIALIQSYIMSLSMYMWGLGKSLSRVRGAFADAYEMAELLEEHSSEPIYGTEESAHPKNNAITFSGITFGYTNHKRTIQDFSFHFSAGRRYGLIGETGSGKSTLMKLLLRVYDQESGSITVCDHPIQTIHKLVLRSWISYVPQDPHFPSWTVREIIRMGNPDASDEAILEAAKKASCEFVWEKLPYGLDTQVGERGIRLSGGERQRLAIAAAILKNAPIVIMDEPTSALDAKTEHSIQQAIQYHFEGKTVIVIAHRLATVAVLDEILLLEHGTIKDFGPHDSLLQSSLQYREMWELQTNPQAMQ